ncbi:RICIN domain-containing protein [Streptomyces coffeae]|uniref:Ricin-type beta-trefoil lectin domain protein n=1 Tax=Streptomyces coffeae TaxID=621382 RepID=A0ABS1NPS4_9ACTN|nr:RICIN domain-containing protein [Streptomyces coffeae]MBL1102083.1 ricin-type beta-trefoil lectin domain protein [Streptomyces coffeae]
MTVETITRRPASRRTAAMLAVLLAALGVMLSPPNAPRAHADTGSFDPEMSVRIDTLQADGKLFTLFRDYEYADGTAYTIGNPNVSGTDDDFTIRPNDDGTFRLVNGTSSKCVDVSTGTYAGNISESDCGDTDAQKWYLQPESDTAPYNYLIRHVGDNKCMAPTTDVSELATVGVRDCIGGNRAQVWWVGAGLSHQQAQLRTMAIKYALTQFNSGSSTIPTATYKVDSSTTAALGAFQNVTAEGGRVINGTTENMDKQVSWSQTTGYTYTAGGSVTTTGGLTIGGENSPVKAQVEVAVQGNWSNSWKTDNTKGGFATIHIRPNEYGWFMRAQLTKQVTGTWTITNDVGNTFTGTGTATLPAKEGTDDKNSDLIGCSSDSTLQVCKDHDPGRA